MALQTDLNVSPYYDDFDPAKNFYRVLFQPGVAVQARELNQLQTILQAQIEKFGDNIFKRGTIIEGCNITLHATLPYIKIKDLETDGTPINVSLYDNLSVTNTANVTGYIVKTDVGLESRAPDLNTLYVKYNSSGIDSNTGTFSSDDKLTVFSPTYPIFKIRVSDGSSSFVNSDSVVIVSAIAIQNSSGGSTFPAGAFVAGNYIQNGVANGVIIEANTTANTSALILKIKPITANLLTANTILWRFSSGETIRNANTANTASIVAVIGSGAAASIVTDRLGKILDPIAVTAGGSGYYVPPYITVKINSNTSITASQINQFSATALNYLAVVTVANSALSPIGTGYGLTVDNGTIYQKGFFSRVTNQLVVINKYSNTGFDKSVGFLTLESTVNSNQDQTLLDNATGTYNYAAPGADRLKLVPNVYVLDKTTADANTDFMPIVEFSGGLPYKKNDNTVYNILGDYIASRFNDSAGNFVLDQFNVATKDSSIFSDSADVFKIYVDPGRAYIKGYQVATVSNYTANVAKGVDYANNNSTIRLGYGSYILVKERGGVFQFNTGAIVDLQDTVSRYITTTPGAAITAGSGTKIGTGRLRSIILESGDIGTASAVYRLYLFDIRMSAGKNFNTVRSLFYNGTNKGVADCILDTNNNTTLKDTLNSSLMFQTVNAMKSANNLSYTYRTINESETANTSGYITINLGVGEYFPYSGTLSGSQENELLLVPKANYQASANASGAANTVSGTAVVIGTTGMNFNTAFIPGDFIKIANSTASIIKQIAQIASNTSLTLTSNSGTGFTGANVVLYFPQNIAISLSRPTRTAIIEANGQMTINIATGIANSSGSSSSANVAIVYNATRNSVSSAAKTSNRKIFARIKTSNNAGGVRGPWALGVSDVYRMSNVYQANGAPQTLSINANTGVTNSGTANAFITVTNNPFANGDSLVYSNTAGTTRIGGISNANTYFAVHANNSGFALASSMGGANLAITANTISEVHTLTGSPLYFTANTFGVNAITNQFYIDNNQTEEYLDTSYLYSKPRAALFTTNDVFLVQFDAFTSSAGIKTVSSYPINDSANLAVLSIGGNINTLEIPEVVGKSGQYYDLRDQFDFRPVSANTIALTSNASSSAIINPTEPSDLNRFAAGTEQYFPVPDSNLSANIAYYLGRTDRVVIDTNANFVVKRGTAGLIDKAPPEPADSVSLQIIQIPPYPSLPQALSNETAAIADTKIANEVYTKRTNNFKVKTLVTREQQNLIQPRGYTMSAIAGLERRIHDLEYYVSFTLAEAIAKTRFIPSSISALLDRFRYGFYVDPFTDYNLSDISNPEYYATIKDHRLSPKLNEFNLEFMPDAGDIGIITLPYVELVIVSQNDATDGPIPIATPIPIAIAVPTGPVSVITVTQTISTVQQAQRSRSYDENGAVFEEFYYTMSSLAGPAKFYIAARNNDIAAEIQQSSSPAGPWLTTISSASALAITSADIIADSINLNGRDIDHPGSLDYNGGGPPGVSSWIEDQFKLLWTHEPTSGQYYKIKVYKGKRRGGFLGTKSGTSGTFEFKLFYPGDHVSTVTTVVSNPASFGYIGIVNSIIPQEFTITQSMPSFDFFGAGYIGNFGVWVGDSQKFIISVTSLKPNTSHKFIFNGEDLTAKCKQVRTETTNTSGLFSDGNGVLTFDFYFDAGITEASSDMQQQNKLAAAAAGIKSFQIQSYDGASTATGSIGLKYYTNLPSQLFNVDISSLNATLGTTSATLASSPSDPYQISAINPSDSVATTSINTAIQNTTVTTVDILGAGGNIVAGGGGGFGRMNNVKLD